VESYEKEGVFIGAYCINPLNGRRMPIYTANFALMEYGTGAVMSVPAHDQRDLDFARKFGLDVVVVVKPYDDDLDSATMTEAFTGEGILVNSGQFDGLESVKALDEIASYLEQQRMGKKAVSFRLRDWGISRQRYWGTPIPMIHCRTCGTVPVPEEDLPILLPEDIDLLEGGKSPLPTLDYFVTARCPVCGDPDAKRETDTMDTFVESSWYYERYCSPNCESGMFDSDAVDYWMPVDQYIGGVEHAILHLLYSRYFTRVLNDFGLVKCKEPFTRLLKKNVIEPNVLLEKYGADTTRLFCLFAAPPERDLEWSEQGVEGGYRFLKRFWRLALRWMEMIKTVSPFDGTQDKLDPELRKVFRKTHSTIYKVTKDIEDRYHFNTAISAIMELVNMLYGIDSTEDNPQKRIVMRGAMEAVALLLSPIVPHFAEELWETMGFETSVVKAPWPSYSEDALVKDDLLIVVQVNGKLRNRFTVGADADDDTIKSLALSDERIQKFIDNKPIKKVIVVKKKLVNIVV
jgi:leucyl-tRNA synthetase